MTRWFAMVVMSVLAVAPAFAQELVGEWDMKMDYQGTMLDSKMVVTKGDDGALTGVWSGRRGDSDLQNLTVDGNNVTFTRTIDVQGQQFDIAFSGTIDGDSITGAFETAMGTMDVTGTRAGGGAAPGDLTPLLGDWIADVSSALGEFVHTLTFRDDGTGIYDADAATYDITEVTHADGNVSFKMTIDLEGQELPMTFEGKLDGGALDGQFITEFGNGTVSARRPGAETQLAIVGTWDVTSESELGTLQRTLVVNPSLSGVYKSDEAEWPISNVAQSGNDVTFDVTVNVQGQELPLTFEGVIDGDILAGELKSELGNGVVTAKRASGGGDGELAEFVDEYVGVIKAQDVEGLMAYYADDFSADGSGKAELKTFLLDAKDQGFLEDVGTNTENVELAVNGETATIEGVELEGAFGVITLNFDLAKRDGKWVIVSQSQY